MQKNEIVEPIKKILQNEAYVLKHITTDFVLNKYLFVGHLRLSIYYVTTFSLRFIFFNKVTLYKYALKWLYWKGTRLQNVLIGGYITA